MIVEKYEEEEEVKHQASITSQHGLPKLGAEFKKHSKEAVDYLILKTRFPADQADRKTLFKRRDDWIKDLNMNLVKGKVVKSTHYFD